jgi:uncharacterized protein (DUF1778 family)
MGHICGLMDATQFLKTRVPAETKALIRAAAEREYVTESIWFRRAIEHALLAQSGVSASPSPQPFRDRRVQGNEKRRGRARLSIRLRPDDRLLLRERAAARGMPSATYISVIVRAHLRNLAPIPKDELVALKRSVAELGAIGRNLNQIARAANSGDRVVGPAREDLRAILKVCEALRDNVKGLIRANVNTWEIGHVETER